jgi:hypothetical protein
MAGCCPDVTPTVTPSLFTLLASPKGSTAEAGFRISRTPLRHRAAFQPKTPAMSPFAAIPFIDE